MIQSSASRSRAGRRETLLCEYAWGRNVSVYHEKKKLARTWHLAFANGGVDGREGGLDGGGMIAS
jgi:hypothetical protein